MEGGNAADPPPVLLSHGRPNPCHKWARMWIALPFSQQPVSVLSMAFNWLRIIYFFSPHPNKTTTWDKASTIIVKRFLGGWGWHYCQKINTAIDTQLQEWRICRFSCLCAWLFYMSRFDYVFFFVHAIIIHMKETFACVLSSHKGLLPYGHLSKTLLSCRFFLFSYYFKASLTLCIVMLSELFISMKSQKWKTQ